MDSRHLKDPAAGVPQQLAPHLHLVSKHRYPMLTNPNIEQIVNYLAEAPKVMREVAPVQWQYLDGPPDGSMFLVWQPLEMQTNFASDGYVWSDAETPFNSEVRGYSVQMFWHRTGYKPNAEQVATHSRKRYRLVPNSQMPGANPDPSLWLIHYSKAHTRDQHPASSLPIPQHIAQSFQQRAAIQRSGQLPRKEFMLHDRTSWPIINLPTALTRGAPTGQLASGHRRGGSLQEHQATLEEEEDVSRGDALDFMTPRDISRMRYEQHHEWMEEILESHYASKNIIPSDLGLGRKGTLESFTNGFFAAPMSTAHEPAVGKVGKLPPGQADEFTKHAEQKLVEMQAELEKMKQDHARRMERLKKTTVLGAAERKLRNMNTSDDSYKTIGAKVQDLVGRKIEPVQHLSLVAKGGMQDIKPIVRSPTEMFQSKPGNVAQTQPKPQQYPNLNQQQRPPQQQQQHQQQSRPTQPQQQNQQTQQVPLASQQTANISAPSKSMATTQQKPSQDADHSVTEHTPQVTQPGQIQNSAQTQAAPETSDTPVENNDAVSLDNDLNMNDPGDQDLPPDEDDDVDDNDDPADWDMLVDQSGDNDQGAVDELINDQLPANGQAPSTNRMHHRGNNDTPRGDANDFDMVTDFDQNMDTAGDALADYGGGDDDLNLEESAFGDAFHSHEQELE